MAKKIQLQIADPCHENWDQMTAADKGRFCASCQKQVMDFTSMSDSQLAAFFKKPTGSVCGRFYNDQLERDIEIPKKRIPWVKYFFQFALPAFLISMKATAQGKVKARIVTNTVSAPACSPIMGAVAQVERKTLPGDTTLAPVQYLDKLPLLLQGKVIDEDNNRVSFATIMIKGTRNATMADSAGAFQMKVPSFQTEVILVVSSVGYETAEVKINKEADLTRDIMIRLNQQMMGEVIVVGYPGIKRKEVTGSVTAKKTDKMIMNTLVITSPPEIKPMIKIYPNPVKSGTNINVGCQKLKEGYYSVQLSNQSGQQVLNKQTWIDEDAQVLNIDIPVVTAGIYFLKLTNKETDKRFTAKVIVE